MGGKDQTEEGGAEGAGGVEKEEEGAVRLHYTHIQGNKVSACDPVLTSGLWSRLCVQVWEDRVTLARLKEKLSTEDGRLILRIEQEEWRVSGSVGFGLGSVPSVSVVQQFF